MKLRMGMGFRMSFFVGVVVLAATTIVGVFLYFAAEKMLVRSYTDHAMNIATKAVKQVDHAKFERVAAASGGTSGKMEDAALVLEMPEYVELRAELNHVRTISGLRFLYAAIRRADKSWVYLIDGLPPDANANELSLPGKPLESPNPQMARAMEQKQPTHGGLWTDEYGTFVSSFVPILTPDGGVLGVLGADFAARPLQEDISRLRMTGYGLVALMTVIALILTF